MEKTLLHKYFRGETSEEEERQIMDWAEASPAHFKEYLEERKLWNALLVHETNNKHKKGHHFSLRKLIQYAAIVAVLCTTCFYFLQTEKTLPVSIKDIQKPTLILDNKKQIALSERSFAIKEGDARIKNDNKNNKLSYQGQGEEKTSDQLNHLLIPHGQTYQVELSDGTLVTLNAESELIFPSRFEAGQRNVTLIGEAYFQVARDEQRPFIVQTEQLKVQVLGTTFNVSCYPSNPVVRTTLVEGSVKVEQGNDYKIIGPSEQYTYNKETRERSVETVDTYLYTSWVNNEYIFKNATLEEVFAQIGHWHNFNVLYENENLKHSHFTFKVSRDVSLDQIIKLINNTDEVSIEKTNHTIHIKNKTTHE